MLRKVYFKLQGQFIVYLGHVQNQINGHMLKHNESKAHVNINLFFNKTHIFHGNDVLLPIHLHGPNPVDKFRCCDRTTIMTLVLICSTTVTKNLRLKESLKCTFKKQCFQLKIFFSSNDFTKQKKGKLNFAKLDKLKK